VTDHATHPTPPATSESRFVVVSASCWACGQVIHKQVPRREARHRHLAWTCEQCDVSWAGPGAPAGSDA